MQSSVLTPPLLGSTEPRLWTPPLRELTSETSRGFDQVEFARDVLHRPADPWQEWLMVHAGELLPDGRPRFRIVLVLVARQNGKTETPVILSAYWQFVTAVPLILGTSTKLEYAKESWVKAVKLVEKAEQLNDLRPKRWKRETNGEQESWTIEGSRYKIAASNEEGGRSLTVHRLILDELRQHHSYAAWDASEPATSAVRDAQIWALSNAGDDRSVVLNDLREAAIKFIETGEGDYRLGLFEWSAPEDADPTDPQALAQANPNYGRRLDPEVLLLKARRAVEKGGDVLAGFKTENMCIRVRSLAEPPAIPEELWLSLLDEASAPERDVALAVDVEPNQRNSSIVVYGLREDGRGHVELVAYRPGMLWLVPALVRLKEVLDPVAIGLDDKGAGRALLKPLADVGITPPEDWDKPARGDLAVPFAADVASAWGSFLAAVRSDGLRHIGQAQLTAAVGNAKTRPLGDAEALARRTSTGDISPAVAGTRAKWAYDTRVDKVREDFDPGAWVL